MAEDLPDAPFPWRIAMKRSLFGDASQDGHDLIDLRAKYRPDVAGVHLVDVGEVVLPRFRTIRRRQRNTGLQQLRVPGLVERPKDCRMRPSAPMVHCPLPLIRTP